jgi:hypothetical protein
MRDEKALQWLIGIGIGFLVVNAISEQPWCGPVCREIMSDFRGTLVEDLVTGLRYRV